MNPNCDNDRCRSLSGEVRVLPLGGDGNAILCHRCYCVEMLYRRERNKELGQDVQYALLAWESLDVYREAT